MSENYLKEHKIDEILTEAVAALLHDRSDKPISFIVDYLSCVESRVVARVVSVASVGARVFWRAALVRRCRCCRRRCHRCCSSLSSHICDYMLFARLLCFGVRRTSARRPDRVRGCVFFF